MLGYLCRRRDLGALDAIIGGVILVAAVFMWTERSIAVDPDLETDGNWAWQLWQIGPLVFSFVGVWLLWRGTHQVAWVRTLFLSLLALAILINQYTDGFGDHSLDVWYTIDPLFIACGSVAAMTGWGRAMTQKQCDGQFNPATMAASNIGSGLAVALFINAYFFNDNETAFEILDPLMILALLIWAIGARRVDVAGAETEAVAETETGAQ